MIYCMSDIHGRIDLFEQMLDKIGLKKGDKLYILGDVIDRGGGLAVVQKIMELQEDDMCELLLGNHELIFLYNMLQLEILPKSEFIKNCDKIVQYRQQIAENSKEKEFSNNMAGVIYTGVSVMESAFLLYRMKQAQAKINQSLGQLRKVFYADSCFTFDDFGTMPKDEREKILDFLKNECYFEKKIKVNDEDFVLSHTGFFGGIKNGIQNVYESYSKRENFYNNPIGAAEPCKVIFGHTTTRDIKIRRYGLLEKPYTIWHDDKFDDKIGIDCGACYPNGQLACLRLDDGKEFYIPNKRKFIIPVPYISEKFKNVAM